MLSTLKKKIYIYIIIIYTKFKYIFWTIQVNYRRWLRWSHSFSVLRFCHWPCCGHCHEKDTRSYVTKRLCQQIQHRDGFFAKFLSHKWLVDPSISIIVHNLVSKLDSSRITTAIYVHGWSDFISLAELRSHQQDLLTESWVIKIVLTQRSTACCIHCSYRGQRWSTGRGTRTGWNSDSHLGENKH